MVERVCTIDMVRFSPSIKQRKNFVIAKLTIWVWCSVAIMNGQVLYVFTDTCKQIAYIVKQLNYVWQTAGITE